MTDSPLPASRSFNGYTALLLFIAGMGGLLYGYDIGIIGAALLYLGKTVNLTLSQESLVVAAVLGGGTISSLVAGALADLIGRKKVMVLAGAAFVASVGLIVAAHGFLPLFLGRVLQGLSAGMIAVVIPLYLAESLPADIRGRGTAAFQLMLTIGIFASLAVGTHYTAAVEAQVAQLSPDAARAAQDGAWRAMFRSALYPGIVFLAGSFAVRESPRWQPRRRRSAVAARLGGGSLAQRKYVVPFLLTCAVLGLNQATGINSILQFLVVILQQAGLPAAAAARQGSYVTLVNVAFTLVGLLLVDRLGRTALLKIGTAGIVAACVGSAGIFLHVERGSADVTAAVAARLQPPAAAVTAAAAPLGHPEISGPSYLKILYSVNGDEQLVTAFSTAAGPGITLPVGAEVRRAKLGPVAGPAIGVWITVCLMLFIACFAVGPGVCVWLALSELMPTRIRSWGMGIGLLINQGISTAIAALFLPFVANFGYAAAFIGFAGCTVLYFLTAAFLLPETKGRTLEEIEAGFDGKSSVPKAVVATG